MDQRRNQKRNKKKIPWDKWKWKGNIPKTMGYGRQLKKFWEKFTVINAYIKKKDKERMDLPLHLKELGKEEQNMPKISRRKDVTKIWA